MKEILMQNLKNYEEILETKVLEKKYLLKEINDFKKLEKMVKDFEKVGGVVELPNVEEKKLKLKEVELEIKMCKSIMRRYGNVISMYSSDIIDSEVEDEE